MAAEPGDCLHRRWSARWWLDLLSSGGYSLLRSTPPRRPKTVIRSAEGRRFGVHRGQPGDSLPVRGSTGARSSGEAVLCEECDDDLYAWRHTSDIGRCEA